ncbi:MAG TPA: gluconate 2-dehydrogenase subunit 3 family protein [Kofleriaceae bacterium]
MLTRRRFVQLLGGTAAVATLPQLPGCGDGGKPSPSGAFFEAHQWATIDAATEIILPGAHDAMAVRYIDQLLAAFVSDPPQIFAGGPNSGRVAFPDAAGQASSNFPADDWSQFVPLSRVKDIAWRMRVLGSARAPGGGFNAALLGPTLGYQDQYTDLVVQLDAAAALLEPGKQFRELSALDQVTALATVGAAFPLYSQTLTQHTLEGMFAAPDYGGNAAGSGWQLARFDGDSAPLGYAQYDTSTMMYVERAAQPTTTATPGDGTEPFDADIINVLTIAAVGSGGKRFF